MDKNSSDRFAEPTIIGTESEARQYVNRAGVAQSAPKSESRANKFDAEKFLRQGEEKSKAEAERRKNEEAVIKEYSIPWDYKSKTSPFPGLVLNPGFVRWEPVNLEEFIREHGEEFKKFKIAMLTNQSGNRDSDQSPKSDSEQATIMTKTEMTPKLGTSESGEPPASKPQPKVNTTRKKAEQTKVKEDPKVPDNPPIGTEKKVDTPTNVIIATDVTEMVTIGDADSRSKDSEVPPLTPKVTRVSAKMRRASRKEFHDTYLVKTDTKNGKPITIAADLVERAYRICARSGDYRTCPTYLFNNLLREVLDAIESDTEGWATLD